MTKKEDFLNAFHKLELLRNEVTDLGRVIKIWEAIALEKT